MPKGIEDETCTVEDLRPIRVFRSFEIDLTAHAVEDFGEFAENTLPDVTRQFRFVRWVCRKVGNDTWSRNVADTQCAYADQVRFGRRPTKATSVITKKMRA